MSRFCKRYICCSIFLLIIIFLVYYRFYGQYQLDRIIVSSDEFVAIQYVLDEEGSVHHSQNQLLNLTNFHYVIQPADNVCDSNANLLAILLVTSYVGHDEVRSTHRRALSNYTLNKLNIVRVFLLAEIPEKEKFISQSAIENEHLHFNDIVQGNFMEAYHNLSYKHVMGLNWASSHKCLRPKFIIKMDDDIVVDIYRIVDYLSEQNQQQKIVEHKHFLAGHVFRHVEPIRKAQNKWFVSGSDFSDNVYPDYLSGWMYVTVPLTAKTLVAAASEPFTPIFWIDDTWITGILRAKSNIPIDESLNELFSANSQFLDCCIDDMEKHKYSCPFVAGPNGGDDTLFRKYIKAVQLHCFNGSNDNKCKHRDPNIPSIKDTCVGSDKHLLQSNHGMAIISAVKLVK